MQLLNLIGIKTKKNPLDKNEIISNDILDDKNFILIKIDEYFPLTEE